MKREITVLTTLLSLGSVHAMGTGTPVPTTLITAQQQGDQRIMLGTQTETPKLTSVGEQLLWLSGDQTLNVTVARRQLVSILLESPALDPRDYRNTDYGDERYTQADTQTQYTLLGPTGAVIAQRTFAPTDAPQSPHASFQVGLLDAGTYTLKVHTTGKAKNTFAVRTSGATITATSVNVNVHSRDWVTAAQLSSNGLQKELLLSLYDTDGPQELEVRLVAPDGRVTPLTGGGDRTSLDVLRPDQVGLSLLQVRQPETAKQYSNTIRISAPGVIPITVAAAEPSLTMEEVKPVPVKSGQPTLTAPQTVTINAPQPQLTFTPEAPSSINAPQPEMTFTPEPTPEVTPAVTPEVTPEPAPAPSPEPEPAPVTVNVPSVPQAPDAPAVAERISQITLTARVSSGGDLLISQLLPDGGELSSAQGVTDTNQNVTLRINQRTLYVTLPAGASSVTYTVRHSGPLSDLKPISVARVQGTQIDVLQGKMDTAQAVRATEVKLKTSLVFRPDRFIQSPAPDTHALNNVTDVTISGQQPLPQATLNGVPLPENRIGETRRQGNWVAYTFIALPLQAGQNILKVGDEQVIITAPGRAAQVSITPIRIGKGAGQSTLLQVTLQDKDGETVSNPLVNLNVTGAQVLSADAQPTTPGLQLALKDGSAVLEVRPDSPTGLTITSTDFKTQAPYHLNTSLRGVALVQGSVSVSFAPLHFRADGQASVETPLLGGQLRLNADARNLQPATPTGVPQRDLGDASVRRNDLTARGPLAFSYIHPEVQALLSSGAAHDPVSGKTLAGDGFSVTLRPNAALRGLAYVQFSGDAPHETFALDQTNLTTAVPFVPGTQLVRVKVRTDSGLQDQLLIPGEDYETFPQLSKISLMRPAANLIKDGVAVELSVEYVPENAPLYGAPTGYGVGAEYRSGGELSGDHAQAGTRTVFGLTRQGTLSVASLTSRYTRDLNNISVTISRSAAPGASGEAAELRGRAGDDTRFITGAVTYRSSDYAGQTVNAENGLSANVRVRTPVVGQFGTEIGLSAHTDPDSTTFGGDVAGTYRSGAFLYGLGAEDQVQITRQEGVETARSNDVRAVILVEHDAPFKVHFRHAQSLTGKPSSTEFSAAIPLGKTLNVTAQNQLNWSGADVTSQGSVSLGAHLGGGDYALTYGVSGTDAGTTTLSARQQFPLTKELVFGVRASINVTPSLGGLIGADVKYTSPDQKFSAGLQTDTVLAQTGSSFSVRPQLNYHQGDWNVTLDGQSKFNFSAAQAATHAYLLSSSYRQGPWNAALSARYAVGSADERSVVADLGYTQRTYEVRLGAAMQSTTLNPLLTTQAYVGTTVWLNDVFGVGAAARGSWSGNSSAYGFGIEASYRFTPGWSVSAGYNFSGFDAITGMPGSQKGVYLRLNVLQGGLIGK